MLTEQQDKRFNELFDELVPMSGMADTLGGEIVRAVTRIQYRYYNDGDIAWNGYGRKTVNPSVRFLQAVCEGEKWSGLFAVLVEAVYNFEPGKIGSGDYANRSRSEKNYEALIDALELATVDFVIENKLNEKPNKYGDMLNYADPEEDVEWFGKDDEDEDYYEDDEDDWDDEDEE